MRKYWTIRNLSEVSSIAYGYTEKARTEPIGPKFLRITDIQNDAVDWDAVPYCDIDKEEHEKHKLVAGDIVFARTGATTGKSYMVSDPPDAVCASYLIRLRPQLSELVPKFISYYFSTKEYWDAVSTGISGSAQGGFNASKLGALKIPIPPLPEQKRIVTILNEALSGLATATVNTEKNCENARELFASYLQATFTTDDSEWKRYRLDQVCSFSSGGTPSKANASFWDGDVPWVSGKDMKSDRIGNAVLHISHEAVELSATRVAPVGSLLIHVSSPSGFAGPAAHETLLVWGRVAGTEVGILLVRLKPDC